MANSKHTMDMCNGPILKKMLLFAVPLMLSSMLQLLFNAADVVVVGRFAGETSLAAVGSTTVIINLLTNLFIGLAVGVNVLVARYFGAKEEAQTSDTVHTAMAISVISGVLLTVVGMCFAPNMLVWMKTPTEVLPKAVLYLRTYFAGMTATMVYNFGSAVLRAVGDTRRPLYILSAAGVVNVALNLVFVIGLNKDVFGVALATVISQVISAVCVVLCLLKEEGSIRLEWSKLRIQKDKLFKILGVGLPAGFQSCMFSLANVVVQSSINLFGETVVAGNSAASNIEGFMFVAMSAFHQAAISFISQNLGAGRRDRINRIQCTALGCVAVIAMILGAAFYFGAPLLIGLYTDNPDVIAAGTTRLHVMSLSFILAGLMDMMVGGLRGLGYSMMPMIVSVFGICALRVVWLATVFQMPAYHTIDMIYITYPISWAVTLVAHTVCFLIARRLLEKKQA
ncbi:MAG: MATE family efflux transporter [Clostridia bacterium]|nr:MATE family efflux transporter [Clostridia bacterium]